MKIYYSIITLLLFVINSQINNYLETLKVGYRVKYTKSKKKIIVDNDDGISSYSLDVNNSVDGSKVNTILDNRNKLIDIAFSLNSMNFIIVQIYCIRFFLTIDLDEPFPSEERELVNILKLRAEQTKVVWSSFTKIVKSYLAPVRYEPFTEGI